jgi:multidrug transporter EmrE-like cation transporter
MIIAGIVGFWVLYAATFCVFKRGSISKSAWLPCFIIGNVFGISATAVLMLLYKVMSANIAMGITLGGGFVISQFALSVIYKRRLTLAQYLGIGAISAGIFMLLLGRK